MQPATHQALDKEQTVVPCEEGKLLSEKEPASEQKKEGAAVVRKDIGAEIELFLNQIDALAETLPLATIAIQGVRATSSQQLTTFLKEECKVVSIDGTKTTYSFEGGQRMKFKALMRRVHKAALAQMLVPRGLLVALVSQFDAYVGGLIRQLFKLKPEIVDSSGTTICTDENSSYIGLRKDYAHRTVNHNLGQYSHNGVTTNSIESVFAVLRRGLHGVYHKASRKHIHRYVNEFAWRLNEGNVKRHSLDRLDSFVDAVTGRGITYEKLIA